MVNLALPEMIQLGGGRLPRHRSLSRSIELADTLSVVLNAPFGLKDLVALSESDTHNPPKGLLQTKMNKLPVKPSALAGRVPPPLVLHVGVPPSPGMGAPPRVQLQLMLTCPDPSHVSDHANDRAAACGGTTDKATIAMTADTIPQARTPDILTRPAGT